jgi:general stress protein 26
MGDKKDLSREEGIRKLRELAMDAKVCHFVTALSEKPLSSRPMTIQEVDEDGNFWFLSKDSSHKNEEIEDDPEVQLFFSNTSSSEYLSVFGHAEAINDRKKLEELWSPIAKNWFSEGKDDPEVSIIRVIVSDAYYWDTKNNRMIQLLKLAAGAVTGKQGDDGIEGRINV